MKWKQELEYFQLGGSRHTSRLYLGEFPAGTVMNYPEHVPDRQWRSICHLTGLNSSRYWPSEMEAKAGVEQAVRQWCLEAGLEAPGMAAKERK